MADDNQERELLPEYKEWMRKQPALARWILKTREAISRQDEQNNAEYLRHVADNMHRMKEEQYIWSSTALRPDDYYKDRFPLTKALQDNGMFMSVYQIRLKELRGELIRWNHWHSWDLKPSQEPATYPKPTQYDPLNPARPNIRAKRLERLTAH